MKRSMKAAFGLAALLTMAAASPVLADEATAAFQTNVQRAITTLNDMQSLFTRIDQRHQEAAAASAAAAGTAQPDKSR